MGRNQRKKINQKSKKRRIFPSLFCAVRAVNRCFYLVLKIALSSRHRLCKCSCKQGQVLFLQKINMQTPKFSPAFFKRRRNPKAAPLVALRTGRNSFLQGSAGGEAKQSGGLFCRGEPSPGVPRARAGVQRLVTFTLFRKQPCPPDIGFANVLRTGTSPVPTNDL